MGGCAMRAYIRRAVVPAVALSAVLLSGCSDSGSSNDGKAAPKTSAAATDQAAQEASGEPSEAPPSSAPVPTLNVGQTGTWAYGETDDSGTYRATTKMSVTVVSAKYVTPDEIDTTNKPEHGQYVALTLTLKNVGQAPADVSTYGMMKWEDGQTAAQDASTLEGVGEGDDLDTTYKPGQSVTGKLILDVGRKGGTVSYTGTDDPNAEAAFKVTLPS